MHIVSTFVAYIKNTFATKKGATVRYMFPVFLGFAVILGANVISSTDKSYVRLEADKTSIAAGDRFSLEVFANAHVPVNAVDITLRFNPDNIEVIGVDKGQSVLTIWTVEPIITTESVTLRGGTFRKGFLGEHKIATINLKAKKTGSSQLQTADVMLLAGDGKGTPVTLSKEGGSTVNLYIYDKSTNPANIGVDVEVSILTDLDGDGKVSLKDISAFMSAWTSQSKSYDFNGDGKMTFRDFSIILASFFLQ